MTNSWRESQFPGEKPSATTVANVETLGADGVTVAPSATPSSAGRNGDRYDPLRDLYMPSGGQALFNYRRAITRARLGGAAARVQARGDSTTLGVLSGTNPNTLLRRNFTWFAVARDELQSGQMLPGVIGDSFMQLANADDPRFTYGGGGTGPTLATGNTMTFADGAGHDAYDLVILRSGNAASVSVSGAEVVGSPVTVSLAGVTNNQAATFRIPCTGTGAHTIVVTGPATGTAQVTNVEPITTATPPILKIGGFGVSGQSLATLAPAATGSGSNMAPILRPLPDLMFLLMGVNDMRGSSNLSVGSQAFAPLVAAFVTACQAQSTDPVVIIPPSYQSNQSGVPSATESLLFHQAIYDIADQYGCAVLDPQRRWGGYVVTPTTGASTTPASNSAMYDGTHPTLLGYADLGRMVARFLADAAA